MTRRFPLLPVFTLMIAAGLFAACDSGDPIDELSCSEVEGQYEVTAFEFDPDAPNLPTFSFLDTLNTNATRLTLVDGCEFVLTYEFEGPGETTQLVTGGFRVSESVVRLDVAGEGEAEKLDRLYLTGTINLQRLGSGVLESAVETTVDLSEFEEGYEGTHADGNIRLRFARAD